MRQFRQVCSVFLILSVMAGFGGTAITQERIPDLAPLPTPESAPTSATGSTATTATGVYTVDGSRTFDGRAFDYRVERAERLSDSVRFTLRFASPVDTGDARNDTITALYDVPPDVSDAMSRGEKYTPRPLAIVMHILDGNDALAEVMAQALVKRGVLTLRFKLPYYGERGDERGAMRLLDQPEMLARVLGQAMVDMRRVVDLAAARPEVDAGQIGVTGVSLGAIVSASAVGIEPRLNRTMLILGGGGLETILGYSRETAELRHVIDSLPTTERDSLWATLRKYDPLTAVDRLQVLAAQGRVFLITAEEDEVIPPVCAERLAGAMKLPAAQWITLPEQGHYTALRSLPMMLQQLGDFFAEDLPPELRDKKPDAVAMAPRQVLFTMLRQLSMLMTTLPPEGRCYHVAISATAGESATDSGNDTAYEGRLEFVLGSDRRFRLLAVLPKLPEASFMCGQNRNSLWLYSVPKGTLFVAPLPVDDAGIRHTVDPLAVVDPDAWRYVQMAIGMAAGAGIAPDLLGQWITFQELTAGSTPILRMRAKEFPVEAILTVRPDAPVPQRLRISAGGSDGNTRMTGIVDFETWNFEKIELPGTFDPPGGIFATGGQSGTLAVSGNPVTVDANDLVRTISAALNFVLLEYML